MDAPSILRIAGDEPKREGEYPEGYWVGYGTPAVTRIERREENLGTYGIVWFDAYAGDILVASMNALHVAVVAYGEAGK